MRGHGIFRSEEINATRKEHVFLVRARGDVFAYQSAEANFHTLKVALCQMIFGSFSSRLRSFPVRGYALILCAEENELSLSNERTVQLHVGRVP